MNELPVINWELGTRLAGNKREIAEELLSILINNLEDEVTAIHELFNQYNNDELQKRVHRLHGAVCYCGVPRLKRVLIKLETALKTNIMGSLPLLIEELGTEARQLLELYQAHAQPHNN